MTVSNHQYTKTVQYPIISINTVQYKIISIRILQYANISIKTTLTDLPHTVHLAGLVRISMYLSQDQTLPLMCCSARAGTPSSISGSQRNSHLKTQVQNCNPTTIKKNSVNAFFNYMQSIILFIIRIHDREQ